MRASGQGLHPDGEKVPGLINPGTFSLLGCLYGWTATRGSLCARFSWRFVREIAFLRGTFEDIVGGVCGQGLYTDQFPTLFSKGVHIATCKGAAPLVADKCLKTFTRNPSTIINVCYFVSPLRHALLLFALHSCCSGQCL